MLNAIRETANRTETLNGAATHITTGSHCLDLFATIGALRDHPVRDVTTRFLRAYAEDPDLAMKLLFYARDIRGGLGERQVFRRILVWLAYNQPDSVRKNLQYIPHFGRWDDLLVLLDTPCRQDALQLIRQQLRQDLMAMDMGDDVSLLAKWLPSVNTSSAAAVAQAKQIARYLDMSQEVYRKTLVKLRRRIRILEDNMRRLDYSFDYAKQPSKAMFKYRRAFLRQDGTRYRAYLQQVKRGQAQLHTGAVAPYELIRPLLSRGIDPDEAAAIDATWQSLEDFTQGENALVVVDGSGSMYAGWDVKPITVALSLGIYFAERNTGPFHNHFITFSETPQLVQIQGRTLAEKVSYCRTFDEIANTNIQRVFDLVLQAAVEHHMPQEQLPRRIYIISDMEFDECAEDASLTNFQCAQASFAAAGYDLPQLVFWNVNSWQTQQPVTANQQGVALVSGCTPRLFRMLSQGNLNPMGYMLDILGTERYAKIAA